MQNSNTEIVKKKTPNYLVLVMIPIVMWRFYWYVGFNPSYTNLFSFVLSALLLFYFIIHSSVKGSYRTMYYGKFVFLFMILVFLSMINAFLYWGQGVVLTFRATYLSFCFIYFFVLFRSGITYNKTICIVLFFTAVYFVLWLYAISKAPDVVFGNADEIDEGRGFARIMKLGGLEFVYMTYFVSLIKISVRKKFKTTILWIPVLIVSFVLIFFTLSRMIIISSLFVTVIYLFRKKTVYILLFVIVGFFGLDYIMSNEIVESLFLLSSDELSSGSDSALRYVEYQNFSKYYPFHIGTFLFGNGSPHVLSDYGHYEEMLKDNYQFHRADAGYVGLYLTYGISAVILFASLLYKVLKQKATDKSMPFKLFIVMLFIVNITDDQFMSLGIGMATALFVLEKQRQHDESFFYN